MDTPLQDRLALLRDTLLSAEWKNATGPEAMHILRRYLTQDEIAGLITGNNEQIENALKELGIK